MRTPTNPTNLAKINAAFDVVLPLLENLYSRWLDEREYEDIADYGNVIAAKLPSELKLTRATKRPFGFEFQLTNFPEATYAMQINSSSAKWTRVI